MCVDPFTLVAAGVSAAGSVIGGVNQSTAYRTQARFSERQAEMERQQGAYEANRTSRQNDRQLASMRGQYLSSGFALDGSPLSALEDSATEASLDEQAILYGAEVRAGNAKFEAGQARSNASSAMTGAIIGGIAPFVNAASTTSQNRQMRTMIQNPYLMGNR